MNLATRPSVPRLQRLARVFFFHCALAGCGGSVVTVLTTTDGGLGQNSATNNGGAGGIGGNTGAGGGADAGNNSANSGTAPPSSAPDGGSGDGITQAAPSRCGFAPDPGSGSAGSSTASADVVLGRIVRFLDDSTSLPVGSPQPATPTADWAWMQAVALLDRHFANQTEAPGLVRFLTNWLNVPGADSGVSAAHTWSLRLVDPSATLATLLAGPTGDPHRIGILTEPELLAARPTISTRGSWMAENLFCQAVPAPPAGSIISMPPPPPGITERQGLESTVQNPNCATCHRLFDSSGYALDHFDSLGNYRDTDNGSAVDSSGTLYSPLPMLMFTSIDDLAPQLAASCPVAQCFATFVMNDAFGVATGAPSPPYTAEEMNHVANAFADSNFSIRALVKAIVGTPSFLH